MSRYREEAATQPCAARPFDKRDCVLVALEPSAAGWPLTVQRGLEVASSIGGDIVLVSVVFDPVIAGGLVGAEDLVGVSKQRAIDEARRKLAPLARSLREHGAAVEVRVVWDAAPYRGILRAAQELEANLVVVGAHEPRSLWQSALPNTVLHLMRLPPCPLLVVKEPTLDGYSTILVAVDPAGGDNATDRGVLSAAERFARAFGSELRAVHAFPDPEMFALASAVEVSPGVILGTENVAELHRRAVAEAVSAYGIDDDRIDARAGAPSAVILDVMTEQRARLVILGASERGALERSILGSTVETVAAGAACDVLLVPRHPEPLARVAGRSMDARV
ncbi:MAG TPA: universal stress protein [Gammaproteobacteria bacterium]|nr:universal stress protein [Gammaproteobacteria bacterium]